MRILVTAFNAFRDYKINAAEVIAEYLRDFPWPEQVDFEILDTDFSFAGKRIGQLLKEIKPDFALSLGLSPGANAIALERFAVNFMDSKNGDNVGFTPCEQQVIPNAPTAYQVTEPLQEMQNMLTANGIPAQISHSAGTYVCNSVMFHALHTIAIEKLNTRYLFVHIPTLPEELTIRLQKGPSFSLVTTAKTIEHLLAWWTDWLFHRKLLTFISSPPILLRPWQNHDLTQLIRIFSQPRQEQFRPPSNVSDLNLWWQKVLQRKHFFSYAICIKESKIVGELRISGKTEEKWHCDCNIFPWENQDYGQHSLNAIKKFLNKNIL